MIVSKELPNYITYIKKVSDSEESNEAYLYAQLEDITKNGIQKLSPMEISILIDIYLQKIYDDFPKRVLAEVIDALGPYEDFKSKLQVNNSLDSLSKVVNVYKKYAK